MTLIQKIKVHSILLAFLALAGWEYFRIVGNIYIEWLIIGLVVAFYVVWGLWVHKNDHKYHPHIIQEYILLGLLVGMVFYVISVL